MKKVTLLILIFVLPYKIAFAQKGFSSKDRATDLKTKLELTDDQTKKIESIFENNHTKMDALFEKDKNDREASRTAIKEIMDNTDKEIEKVLDKDQLAKYQKLIDERKNNMGRRMPPLDGKFRDGKKMPPAPPEEQFNNEERMPPPPPEDLN
jgi:Spy/CpxP family protein refolding chaperone